jgi:hypothetical protein
MSTIILPSAPANTEDAKRYANGMAEIRQRLGIARTAVSRIRETRNQDLVSTETIFLQMRKVCELIAFGSLIANKELYSQHYETFAEDWRLGRVVDKLRKVNPDFFPVPMSAPYEVAPGHKQAGPSLALSITEGELVDLYNICGRILHSRNPFSTADATHQIGHTVDEWLARLEGLLRWHRIQLVNGAMWLVNMPDSGDVHVTTAVPSNT